MEREYIKYLLPLPLILLTVFIIGYPLVYNLYLSFQAVVSGQLMGFVGLTNYFKAFADSSFWNSMLFSFRFSVLATSAETIGGLLLAIFFSKYLSHRQWLLSFFLLPMLTAPVLLGLMFQLMLNEFVGIIPSYLSLVGISIYPLGTTWVVPTILLADFIQWTPFAFLIIYTGLQSLPQQLMEAGRVDGSNAWQLFRYITLPLLVPSIAIVSFLRFIDTFRIFDKIFILTGGGPGQMTTTASIYIYKTAFQSGQFGKAIASSIFFLIFALIPLWISMKFVLRGGTAE